MKTDKENSSNGATNKNTDQPAQKRLDRTCKRHGRDAEQPGPSDARQGFPERELPCFRKEASILRTKTSGSQRKFQRGKAHVPEKER